MIETLETRFRKYPLELVRYRTDGAGGLCDRAQDRSPCSTKENSEDGIAPLLGLENFQYSAFDVVISATSRCLYTNTRESRSADLAALNELMRMTFIRDRCGHSSPDRSAAEGILLVGVL